MSEQPVDYQETEDEKKGVDAIVALQKFVGVHEPRQVALMNWRRMNAADRVSTLIAYDMFCVPKEE